MMGSNIKKTHPMVLIAATAMTVFSLIGSAVITGLIPVKHTYRPDLAQQLITDPNAAMVISSTLNQKMDNLRNGDQQQATSACRDCGIVVAIHSFENSVNSRYNKAEENMVEATYLIKVKMDNGRFHIVTQHSTPRCAVGDNVRLRSGRLVSA